MSASAATFLVAAIVAALILLGFAIAAVYDNRAAIEALRRRLDAMQPDDE